MLFYIDFGCAFNGHVITMSHIYRAKNQCTTVSCLRICLPFLLSDFGLGAKKKEGREKNVIFFHPFFVKVTNSLAAPHQKLLGEGEETF